MADSFRFRFSPDLRRSDTDDLPARGEPRDGRREAKSEGPLMVLDEDEIACGGVSNAGLLRWERGVEELLTGDRELRSGGIARWREISQ